jgi:hypothetical protein
MDDKNNREKDREAVRVDTSFPAEFRILPESDAADMCEELLKHRTCDRLGMPTPGGDLPADLNNLKDYKEASPLIMKMWMSMEHKVDALIRIAAQAHKGMGESDHGVVTDLSRAGLKLRTRKTLRPGDTVLVRIPPPSYPPFTVDAVGKVVSSEEAEEKNAVYGIEFTAVNRDDRELLITYVFKRQREILRGKQGGD